MSLDFFSGRSRRRYLHLIGGVVVGSTISGCLSPAGEDTPTDDDTAVETTPQTSPGEESSHPNLEAQLYQLATADDPSAYSTEHGIELEDGAVPVTIQLATEDTAVPDAYIERVDDRYGTHLNALVAIEDLIPLAEIETVEFVTRRHEVTND